MRGRLEQATQRHVSRETIGRLTRFVDLLRFEASVQNLVSATTLADVWERHVIDCAQLVRFEPRRDSRWIDLGSGAGLPGIVIACLVDNPVTLVEPRALRAGFLHRVVDDLRIEATVIQQKAEKVGGTYDVITARAVASLPRLLEISEHLSTENTRWILPKGRRAEEELAEAQRTWQGTFHVERSVTDDMARIIVASGVEARPS